MKLSRWLFIISNILIMLVLLYNITDHMFVKTKPYPKHVNKTIFVDNYFNDKQFDKIKEAAQEWTLKTHHIVNFQVERLPSKKTLRANKDLLILPVTPNFPDIILCDEYYHHDNTVGFFNDSGPLYFIEIVMDRASEDIFKSIVLHELGHSLGLEHDTSVDGIGSLMFPALNMGSDHITEEDLYQFCSLYKCDVEKLKN